jgi:DNA-binding NarL/FixJ family response regulator
LAVGDYERLAALASAFAARGGHRLAVECAAAAADRAARAGDRRAARRGAQDALTWAAACHDLATPGLVAVHALSAAVPTPLTARERDVALRAATGSSNRAIADQLGISERTVETHLSRCYDKLHVRTRAALGASLGLDPR